MDLVLIKRGCNINKRAFLLISLICLLVLLLDVSLYAATPQVSAGGLHTVGLKTDGSVVAVGWNIYGQCYVGGWDDIVQVSAAQWHTVGLKSDGTVVAVGDNSYNQCAVGSWTDIVQISAGGWHTVGLKSDGTVVAVGLNDNGECNVSSWIGITQISTGFYHTVGLKSNGTVVAVGCETSYDHGQCNVGSWSNIIQVSAGGYNTSGLISGGTVLAIGYDFYNQCNVGDWSGIVQVSAGSEQTAGLKSDGIVVVVGYNGDGACNVGGWENITQVSAGGAHIVGLKLDNTVVAIGYNGNEACNVGGWNLGQVALSASVINGHGNIMPTSGTYNQVTIVNLTATPDSGYRVKAWHGTDNDASTATTNTVTMSNTNRIVTVEFGLIPITTYNLNSSVIGNNGSVSPISGTYNQGSVVNLIATPGSGYRVKAWHGTDNDASTATTNIVTMNSNRNITVEFGLISYTVTSIVVGQGVISLLPNNATYSSGTSITATANPASGWQFDHWEGDVSGTNNPITIGMNNNKSITAVFIQAPSTNHNLTTQVTGQGSIGLNPIGGSYAQGTVVNLTAIPDSGYQVKTWSGTDNDTSKDTTNTVTMNTDHKVTVEFEPITNAEENKENGDGGGGGCFISTSVSDDNVPQGIPTLILSGIMLIGLLRITRKPLKD